MVLKHCTAQAHRLRTHAVCGFDSVLQWWALGQLLNSVALPRIPQAMSLSRCSGWYTSYFSGW